MAKIDPNTIEGFNEMSAEDKVNALLGVEVEDNAEELKRVKTAFDRAAHDVAELKKERAAKRTAEENAAEERANAEREREEKYKEMERKCNISDNVARFTGLGFDTEGAKKAAEAFVDGNTEELFKLLGEHKANVIKTTTENAYKNTPRPEQLGSAPATKKVYTRDEVNKMSRDEINAHYQEIRESMKSW